MGTSSPPPRPTPWIAATACSKHTAPAHLNALHLPPVPHAPGPHRSKTLWLLLFPDNAANIAKLLAHVLQAAPAALDARVLEYAVNPSSSAPVGFAPPPHVRQAVPTAECTKVVGYAAAQAAAHPWALHLPPPKVLQAVPAALCTRLVGYAKMQTAGHLWASHLPPHVRQGAPTAVCTKVIDGDIDTSSSAAVGFAPPAHVLQAVNAPLWC
jgi:hypothetical protein